MEKFCKKYSFYFKFAIVLLTILTLRITGIFKVNIVVGSSMQPNYYQGDLVVSSCLFPYDYGDVVVASANYGEDNKIIIKRIIAKPGDIIKQKDQAIYLNNEILIENYETMPDDAYVYDWEFMCDDGEYFLVGDNRPISWDSRSIGPIREISGKQILYIPTGKLFNAIFRVD